MWTVLQGSEGVGTAISASDADMAAINRRNSQANQIVRTLRVVLQYIVGTLTMHWEVVTCCYLLHRLLGPQCLLVEALQLQVVNTLEKKFALFLLQISMSYRCTAFAYDVSCIIGNYLNACVKVLATVSLLDLVGLIPWSL